MFPNLPSRPHPQSKDIIQYQVMVSEESEQVLVIIMCIHGEFIYLALLCITYHCRAYTYIYIYIYVYIYTYIVASQHDDLASQSTIIIYQVVVHSKQTVAAQKKVPAAAASQLLGGAISYLT